MALLELYESDDTTLVTTESLDKVAGASTTPVEYHLWNEKGNGAGQAASNVLLYDLTESSTPGTYLRSGIQPQDERWGEVRIIGVDNTGDATFTLATTDWTRLGAYGGLLIGEIPADCAVLLEYRETVPSTAASSFYRRQLAATSGEFSQSAPAALTRAMRGILTGVGDRGRTGLIRGGAVTPTGTPDDVVHAGALLWQWLGDHKGKITTDHTLNQNDGAAAALVATQSYIAVLTAGASGVTVTKGLKAVSPTKPTPPAGEEPLAYVTVAYQAGASVIDAADIEDARVFDRYLIVAGSGLSLNVHRGQALGGGTWRYSSVVQPVALPAASTRYLWQLDSGLFTVTATEVPPSDSALGPWATAVTDGSVVTALTNRRTYADDTVVLVLKGATPGSPGAVDSLLVAHEKLFIEDVVLRISGTSGASGETKGELFINGTTAYTSKATEDHRPRVAFDASVLYDGGRYPEVLALQYGDLLRFDTTSHPSGGSPASVEMLVICRRA